MNKRKIHPTLPIYLEGLSALPKCFVYRLVDPSDKEVFYIGESTRDTYLSRYNKHVNTRGYHSHEGDRKMQRIDRIRAMGLLPLMIIFAGATSSSKAKELETYYKDYYFNKGHAVVNHRSMKPLVKTHVKRAFSSLIDSIFD